MRLPVLQGSIRRRLLINYRVDAETVQRILPAPLRPKLQGGFAVAGICLIRLEDVRPAGAPALIALSSENAAHRVAVEWDGADGRPHEGVYVARRDTGSFLNHLAGSRVFPGEQHRAKFAVEDDGSAVTLSVAALDGGLAVEVAGHATDAWPVDSCFASLGESSAFFEGGSVGYSVTRDSNRLDGMRLETHGWAVRPFAVDRVRSSFFDDRMRFPEGSVTLDHALVMRDLRHEWHAVDDLLIGGPAVATV